MKGIPGKRVLITGGCGDIGQAVARRFLEAGALVMLADLRTSEAGEAIARELHASNAFTHFAMSATKNRSRNVPNLGRRITCPANAVWISDQAADFGLRGVPTAVMNDAHDSSSLAVRPDRIGRLDQP